MLNHVNTLTKNNTVLMFCPWQFQKTCFNLTIKYLPQSKEMSLNDVASLFYLFIYYLFIFSLFKVDFSQITVKTN